MEQLQIHNLSENLTLGEVLKKYGVNFKIFENYWQISNDLINAGAYGKVFEIGNNKVLKITTDEGELNAINRLLEEIEYNNDWFEHFINLPINICPVNENIYEKLNDDSYNDNKKYVRYYFIFDKLYELTNDEKNCIVEIFEYFDVVRVEDIEILYGTEISDYYTKMLKLTSKFSKNVNTTALINFIFNVYSLAEDLGINDLHLGNMMKDINGNYKLIDIRL